MSPSGKAAGFDPAIRRFESFHPSHFGDIAAYSGEARLDGETMALFTGNANPALAQEIARHLMVPLGRSVVGRFSDGEVNVELMENVRGRDVFLVQPTCPPVNDHLMELLIMADACRRASARSVTAVVPYMGYSRQDRRPRATRSAI